MTKESGFIYRRGLGSLIPAASRNNRETNRSPCSLSNEEFSGVKRPERASDDPPVSGGDFVDQRPF